MGSVNRVDHPPTTHRTDQIAQLDRMGQRAHPHGADRGGSHWPRPSGDDSHGPRVIDHAAGSSTGGLLLQHRRCDVEAPTEAAHPRAPQATKSSAPPPLARIMGAHQTLAISLHPSAGHLTTSHYHAPRRPLSRPSDLGNTDGQPPRSRCQGPPWLPLGRVRAMRTLAKYSANGYPVPDQTSSASTDEYYPGSGRGEATAIPPRPRERLHSNGQPS